MLLALASEMPGLPGVHRMLGRAWEACGSPRKALQAFQEEVRRQGSSRELEESMERVRRRITDGGTPGGDRRE